MQLFLASNQWQNRRADERFSSITEMNAVCQSYKNHSHSGIHNTKSLRVEAIKDSRTDASELVLNLDGEPTKMSYFGFHQLCHLLAIPPDYIRHLGGIDPSLAATLLNIAVNEMEHRDLQSLIYRPYEDSYGKLCRSMMTPSYKRIWDAEITERLLDLDSYGWKIPPARPAFPGQIGSRKANAADCLNDAAFSLSVKIGDWVAPAGLYASDHDVFVFMVNPEVYIEENGQPLYRGFFLWNSECGTATLGIMTFLYRHTCGNHIVHGASAVKTLKIKHIGLAKSLFEKEFQTRLIEYANSSAFPDVDFINKAKNKLLGGNKEEVIETVLSQKKKIVIGKQALSDAYDITELNESDDGNPASVWGLVQGITRLSQDTKYADARVKLDTEAGKILALAV